MSWYKIVGGSGCGNGHTFDNIEILDFHPLQPVEAGTTWDVYPEGLKLAPSDKMPTRVDLHFALSRYTNNRGWKSLDQYMAMNVCREIADKLGEPNKSRDEWREALLGDGNGGFCV